jgi:hypothetical protein
MFISKDIFCQIEEQNSLPIDDEYQTKPEYSVEVSMFEIYNEKIKDLLSGNKNELQVREHKTEGPVCHYFIVVFTVTLINM